MSESATSETVTVDERFKDWKAYQEVKEQIAKNGLARVYLIATSCGLQYPKSTASKLEKFVALHKGVHAVEIEHEEWNGNRGSKMVRIPALTALVNNAEVFATMA